MDTRTEVALQAGLRAVMRGRTSFVIAHRLSTIRNADQVVVIEGGRIVERGTHDELLAARGCTGASTRASSGGFPPSPAGAPPEAAQG